jgi:phosphate transport system substrate-binding protein
MFRKFRARAAGLAALLACASAAQAEPFTGAGASFPAPLYQAWAQQYKALTGDELNYQAIGSGGGIRQIGAGTVDFGASDKPLQPADLAKAGLVQFPPWWAGWCPLCICRVGAGAIAADRRAAGRDLSGPYQALERSAPCAANPGLRLPPLPITVVHRSDGRAPPSSSPPAQVSPGWAHGVGASDLVRWPTGIGGRAMMA